MLEEKFQRALYRTSSGEQYLMIPGKLHTMADLMRSYEEVSYEFSWGLVEHTIKLPSFKFKWPRSGVRFYFEIVGFYSVLKLDSSKGFPSKWFYSSKER